MKYCQKCGKELLDEAVVCIGCGCPVKTTLINKVPKETAKSRLRNIALLIIGVIVIAALTVGGYFLYNHIRVTNVVNDLSGHRFVYRDSVRLLYSYSYTEKEMEFDEDGTLTYSYYYSNIDDGDEYERDYKVKLKNKMIILEVGLDSYEIQYDKYGKIKAIYDIASDESFERK